MTKLLEFLKETEAAAANDPVAAIALQACSHLVALIKSPAEEDTVAKLERLVAYADDLQFYVGECYNAAEADFHHAHDEAEEEADAEDNEENPDEDNEENPDDEEPVCG